MVNYLNQLMPTLFKVETELENCSVTPLGKKRYMVILRNSKLTANTAALLTYLLRFDLFLKDDPPDQLDEVMVDEAAVVFDPKNENITPQYAKGIRVDRDASKMVRKEDVAANMLDWAIKWNLKRARLYIGRVIFSDLNFNWLKKIENNRTAKNSKLFSAKNPFNPVMMVQDIRLNFDARPNISIEIGIEGIKRKDEVFHNEDVFRYIKQKNAPLPDIDEILQKGLAILHFGVNVETITISIKKDKKNLVSGSVDTLSPYFFIKPAAQKHLNLSLGVGLKNLKLSFPFKNKIEGDMQLEEGGFSYSLEKINPGVLPPLMKLAKNALELRDSADEKKIRDYMMVEGRKVWSKVLESKSLKFDFNLDLKNFKLSNPKDNRIQLFSHIKESSLNLSYDNMDEKVVQILLEELKNMAQMAHTKNRASIQEMLRYAMTRGMKSWAEMLQTGVVIEYSLAPFRHYFGEFSVKTRFQMNPQAMKSTIKIKKIDEVFKKLEASGLVSPFTLMFVRQGLQQLAVRDGDGNASIVMEMRADQPGIVFLNGIPIKVPASMFKNPMQGLGF